MIRVHRLLVWGVAAGLGACGGEGPTTPPSSGAKGTVITPVANEGWAHVPEGSAVTYRHNPPASGPHYPIWLRYQEFTSAVPRGYWVHNLEHGAVVFLYQPGAPADAIADLQRFYRALPDDPECGHRLAILMPDPQLPRPVAAVAADWVLLADGVDAAAMSAFVSTRRNRGPERVCAHGAS